MESARTWDRFHKNQHREIVHHHAVSGAKKRFAYAQFLPSDECLDLKLFLERGTIDRNTFIYACEQNKSKIPDILGFLAKNFKRFYLHTGQITSFDIVRLVKDYDLDMEYGFQDFCGEMVRGLARWLAYSSELFRSKGAKLAMTFAVSSRTNPFLELVGEKRKAFPKYLRSEAYIQEWQPALNANCELKHPLVEATMHSLIASLGGNFVINQAREYKDSMPMCLCLATKEYNLADRNKFDLFDILGLETPELGRMHLNGIWGGIKPEMEDGFEQFKHGSAHCWRKSSEPRQKPVSAIVERFKAARKPAELAAAHAEVKKYIASRVKEGLREGDVRAAVQAHLTRNDITERV